MSHTEQMREALRHAKRAIENWCDLFPDKKDALDTIAIEAIKASLTAPAAEVPEAMGDAEIDKLLNAFAKACAFGTAEQRIAAANVLKSAWQSTRLRGGVPDGKQQQAWRCEHFFNLRSRVLTAPNGREYELLDDDIRNPRVAAFLGVLLDAVLTAAPQAPAAALDAGVVRDAWIAASDRVPLDADGEVFVRFTDGSIGTAWATYWHGASNDFAQWTHPDPDEDRVVSHWMKAPPVAAMSAQAGKGGAA